MKIKRYKIILLLIVLISCTDTIFAKELVHIGYDATTMSKYSKKDTIIATDVWIKKMLENQSYEVELKYYQDMSEMGQDLENEKIDYVVGYGLNFIKHSDISKLESAFSQGYLDGRGEHFVIVARKESGINVLSDISDNSVVAVDKGDEIAKMYLRVKRYDVSKSDNVNFLELESRNRAILKLFFKKADVAITTDRAFALLKELNPQIGKRIKVIDETKIQSSAFGFFRKSLSSQVKEDLLKTSQALIVSEYGKQILAIYKSETITKSKTESLSPIQEIYMKYLSIEGKVK